MSLAEQQNLLTGGTKVIGNLGGGGTTSMDAGEGLGKGVDNGGGMALSAEYRFVHQRIPQRTGHQRFMLSILLITCQVLFIILFAIFGNYPTEHQSYVDANKRYPIFQDIHVITLLGFGFIMTFLKRYGYGSIGFNILLVALIVQWSLLVRGWIQPCTVIKNGWLEPCPRNASFGQFFVGLNELVLADYTSIAVIISFGAILGKVTGSQLVTMALFEVIIQVFNEYLNHNWLKVYDLGKSMYVHLFGAIFGIGVSKVLNFKGVINAKQSSVYHSDLFAFIGTLFLWSFYPSFNAIFAHEEGQLKAILNTYLALAASTVTTVGISSIVGNGKINVMHVQHSTIAGGIAIGSVAALNLQFYVALIIGALAGLLSTVGYQYLTTYVFRKLRLHDTCGVFNLHAIPAIIAAFASAVFAAASTFEDYKQVLFSIYPGRSPLFNSTELDKWNMTSAQIETPVGRTGPVQAGYQLAALAITFSVALFFGVLVGFFLHLPIFDKIKDDSEMFDDEVQWITPDDYALKLTLARPSELETPLVQLGRTTKEGQTGV